MFTKLTKFIEVELCDVIESWHNADEILEDLGNEIDDETIIKLIPTIKNRLWEIKLALDPYFTVNEYQESKLN